MLLDIIIRKRVQLIIITRRSLAYIINDIKNISLEDSRLSYKKNN